MTVELGLSLNGSSWITDVLGNGYKIIVGPVPYIDVQSPLGAPHGAETFVKVAATKHILAQNCAPYGKLELKNPDFLSKNYDPEGSTCAMESVGLALRKYVSCRTPSHMYRLNSSDVCSPMTRYLAELAFFYAPSVAFGSELSNPMQVIMKQLPFIDKNTI